MRTVALLASLLTLLCLAPAKAQEESAYVDGIACKTAEDMKGINEFLLKEGPMSIDDAILSYRAGNNACSYIVGYIPTPDMVESYFDTKGHPLDLWAFSFEDVTLYILVMRPGIQI